MTGTCTIEWNHNLKAAPKFERVFLLLKEGEEGNGELAVGMISDDNPNYYWTWGGLNAGCSVDERPIAWALLPVNWADGLVIKGNKANRQHRSSGDFSSIEIVKMDQAFIEAMRREIQAGTERVTEGIITSDAKVSVPVTNAYTYGECNPGSPAAWCADEV